MFKNPDTDLEKLFRDEEVFSRAFNFSSPLVTLGNVLGYDPKRAISRWIDEESKRYVFSPEKSGKPTQPKSVQKDNKKAEPKSDDSLIRHDEIKNVSVIRQHLWDEARAGQASGAREPGSSARRRRS